MQPRKLLARISRGDVHNVSFEDFRRLLERLGFSNVRLVNLQDVGGQTKPYQITADGDPWDAKGVIKPAIDDATIPVKATA